MKSAKGLKPLKPGVNKEAHTPNTKYGMGDFYGQGIKNKMGKVRSGNGINPVTPKGLKTPPRKIA